MQTPIIFVFLSIICTLLVFPVHGTTGSGSLATRTVFDEGTCSEEQRNLIAVSLGQVLVWTEVAAAAARNERTPNLYVNLQRRVAFNHWFHTHERAAFNSVLVRFSQLKQEVKRTAELRTRPVRPGEVLISCDNENDPRWCGAGGEVLSVPIDTQNRLILCLLWFGEHSHRVDWDTETHRIGHLLGALLKLNVVRGNQPVLHEDDARGRLRNVHWYVEYAHHVTSLQRQFLRASGEYARPASPVFDRHRRSITGLIADSETDDS